MALWFAALWQAPVVIWLRMPARRLTWVDPPMLASLHSSLWPQFFGPKGIDLDNVFWSSVWVPVPSQEEPPKFLEGLRVGGRKEGRRTERGWEEGKDSKWRGFIDCAECGLRDFQHYSVLCADGISVTEQPMKYVIHKRVNEPVGSSWS